MGYTHTEIFVNDNHFSLSDRYAIDGDLHWLIHQTIKLDYRSRPQGQDVLDTLRGRSQDDFYIQGDVED